MPKLLFTSFSGKEWLFDPQTAQVTPAEADVKKHEAAESLGFKPLAPFSEQDIAEALCEPTEQLMLNVTEACSNRCSYCVYSGIYGHGRSHAAKHMSVETLRTAVDWFMGQPKPTKDRYISFYGGEPTFAEGFERIRETVEYVRERYGTVEGLRYSFTTNGNHLTEERLRFFVEHDFHFMVSLDGPKAVQDRYRRTAAGGPTFDTVMDALARAERLAPEWYRTHVGFICVLTPPLDWRTVSAFFRTNPLTARHSLMVSNVSLYDQDFFSAEEVESFTRDTIAMMGEAAREYLEAARCGEEMQYVFEYGLFAKDLAHLAELQGQGPKGARDALYLAGCCVPGVRKCFVDTDGTLFACEKMQGFYPIGTVAEGLSVPAVYGLMQDMAATLSDKCRRCPYARMCGLCYIAATGKTPKLSAERLEASCLERRSFCKLVLRLYASLRELNG